MCQILNRHYTLYNATNYQLWSWEFFKTSFLVVKAYFPKLDKISCEGRLNQWQSLKVK